VHQYKRYDFAAHMEAIAVPLILRHRPSPVEIDDLAAKFFGLEAKVDQAYKNAMQLDEHLEVVKERLLLITEEFGEADAQAKLLHGVKTELRATFNGPPTLLVRER
jgi:hypothetical protein